VGGAERAYVLGLGTGQRGGDGAGAGRPRLLEDDGTDAAGGTRDEHGLPRLERQRVERGRGRGAGQTEHTRGRVVQAGRDVGDVVVLRHHDVIGESPGGERLGQHDAEDVVAGREGRDAVADAVDGSGEVPTEHGGERVLHKALEVPGGHGDVKAVQRRRPYLDSDLARSGHRLGQFGQARSRSVVLRDNRAHMGAPQWTARHGVRSLPDRPHYGRDHGCAQPPSSQVGLHVPVSPPIVASTTA
jgi:hypothetical protein